MKIQSWPVAIVGILKRGNQGKTRHTSRASMGHWALIRREVATNMTLRDYMASKGLIVGALLWLERHFSPTL